MIEIGNTSQHFTTTASIPAGAKMLVVVSGKGAHKQAEELKREGWHSLTSHKPSRKTTCRSRVCVLWKDASGETQ